MTGSRAPVDLLVVDAVSSRHDSYRGLLGDPAGRVVTVAPGEPVRQQLRSGSFAVVLVNLDGELGGALADIAATAPTPRPPVVVLSDRMPDPAAMGGAGLQVYEFIPSSHAAELLPGRISCLLELARLKGELAARDGQIDELVRESDLLRAAAADERRTSENLRLRVGEQIHRSKNLLAILQSVTRRTVHDGRAIPEARDTLLGRFGALARAYQLVSASNGKGTEIVDVVETELAEVMHRVTASGPPARLASSVVQTFALAIHELAANASKHGALRSPEGSIAVGWTFFEYGSDRYLEIAWTERGGTPPTPPPKYGFGLSLVSSFAGANAEAPNVTFDAEGLVCRMRLSQDVLVAS